MASEFMGLEIGKRGLLGNQVALNTVSHNLSNSSNKDYSRQQVSFQTVSPLYAPQFNRESGRGQMGQGMEVASIMRVRDEFIDGRIVEEKSSKEFYDTQHRYLTQIESVFAEPGSPTLKEQFDNFVQGWNDLALNSNDMSSRTALVASSQAIVGSMKDHYQNLLDMRNHVNSLIESQVNEINALSSQIRDLNVEIVKVQALKDHPNDLLDKRDALIEKLSQLTNVKVVAKDPKEVFVYIGSQAIVQGVHYMPIKAVGNGEKEGMFDLQFEDGKPVPVTNGSLAALIKTRDESLPEAMQKINNFAINLAETINSTHSKGFGLNTNTGINFFELSSITNDSRGNFDSNNDGQIDSTMLYTVQGNQKLNLTDVVNEGGVLNLGQDSQGKNVIVEYNATDTVRDIINRVNHSSANITMHLNQTGNLVIKALPGNDISQPLHINHLEDSSVFLTSIAGVLNQAGNEGSFDSQKIDQSNLLSTNQFTVSYNKHITNHLSISQAILRDPSNIAARQGKDTNGDGFLDSPNGAGDGSNAFRIISQLTSSMEKSSLDPQVKLDSNPVMIDKGVNSFRPFLDSLISSVGENTKTAKSNLDKQETLLTGLENMRQSISGVNMDEELVQLIKYQRGYQGAAKLISVMDSMLDTVIRLGR